MSDSIVVRVGFDSYDFSLPSEKQTAVHVQIPEVARATYMLPAERYHGLKDRAWPEVLDVAHEHYEQGWAVTDSSSAAARAAVRAWLLEDPNRDEMQAAFEEDRARRDPAMRQLLGENKRLRSHISVLEAQRERRRLELVALRTDALTMRGTLAPNGEASKVPFVLGETLAPAVEWLVNRVAGLEAAQTTAYRAQHDSIVMGLYTTRQAAYEHCEAYELRDDAVSPMAWNVDEEGVAELVRLRVPRSPGAESPTGYVVTPVEIASEYDPDGDE